MFRFIFTIDDTPHSQAVSFSNTHSKNRFSLCIFHVSNSIFSCDGAFSQSMYLHDISSQLIYLHVWLIIRINQVKRWETTLEQWHNVKVCCLWRIYSEIQYLIHQKLNGFANKWQHCHGSKEKILTMRGVIVVPTINFHPLYILTHEHYPLAFRSLQSI